MLNQKKFFIRLPLPVLYWIKDTVAWEAVGGAELKRLFHEIALGVAELNAMFHETALDSAEL